MGNRKRAEGALVGIDVSAKTLAVATRASNGRVYVREIPNSPASHKSLCVQLAGSGAKVCLEATGIYHLDVARALHGTDGIEVMVVNPRASHDFAGAMSKRNKTDISDAEVLLAYVERMEWEPWQAPSEAVFELRTICRHAVSMRQALAADKARLARSRATSAIARVVTDDIVIGIAQLEIRINKLQAASLALIEQDPALSASLARLCTIPGLGPTSAVQVLSELAVLPGDMTAKQWTAHAGLDPRQHQSGTSIDKANNDSRRLGWAASGRCRMTTASKAGRPFEPRWRGRGRARQAEEEGYRRGDAQAFACGVGHAPERKRLGRPAISSTSGQGSAGCGPRLPESGAPSGAPSAHRPRVSGASARRGRQGRVWPQFINEAPSREFCENSSLAGREHGGMLTEAMGTRRHSGSRIFAGWGLT